MITVTVIIPMECKSAFRMVVTIPFLMECKSAIRVDTALFRTAATEIMVRVAPSISGVLFSFDYEMYCYHMFLTN